MEVNLTLLQEGVSTSIAFSLAIVLSKCKAIDIRLDKGDTVSAKDILIEVHNYMFLIKNLTLGVNIETCEGSILSSLTKIEYNIDSINNRLIGDKNEPN